MSEQQRRFGLVAIDHELKTWPEYFGEVWVRRKTFEVREWDRDFKVGDAVALREWSPASGSYSGSEVIVEITYILERGSWGIDESKCIFGFREIGRLS